MSRKGRLQKQLTEIVTEYRDRLLLGGFCQLRAQFALECRDEQTLVPVLNRCVQLIRKDRWACINTLVDPFDIGFVIDDNAHGETALLLAAIDGENAMGGERANGFAVAVIHLKDLRILCIHVQRRFEYGIFPKLFTHEAAQLRLVHYGLRKDITGTRKRIVGGRYFLFSIYVRGCKLLGCPRCLPLHKHGICERLQPALTRHGGSGTFFLLVGAIEILKRLQLFGALDRHAQLFGQFPLLFDAGKYFFLPLDETAQVGESCLHLAQHLIFQRAGCFLAVTRYKWNGIAVIEQCDSGLDLLWTDGEFACDCSGDIGNTHEIKPFFLASMLTIIA